MDLGANFLTSLDSILPLLCSLSNLQHLNVAENKIEEEISEKSRFALRNLRFVSLAENPVMLKSSPSSFVFPSSYGVTRKGPTDQIRRIFLESSDENSLLLRDKIFGLLFGAALGDAFGLATEFMRKPQALFRYGTDLLRSSAIVRDRHRSRWRAGDWTDDTDQLLLLLRNVSDANKRGEVDVKQFAESLLQWAHRGFPEMGKFFLTDHRSLYPNLGRSVYNTQKKKKQP